MYTKDELGYKKRVKKKSKRPMELTIVCMLVVLFGFFNLIDMFIRVYPGIKTIYPALNALVIVFSFVSISGVWNRPGAMVTTRTPNFASSRAAGSVRETIPPFDAA